MTAGPFLDGRWPGGDRWVLEDADDAHAAVRRLVALRVDFVKVHDALSREAFDCVIEAAGSESLPVAGHVPRSVSYEDAVAAGMASTEHVNQLAERLLTSGSMASEDALDAEVAALVDGRGGALFAAMVEHGTAFTPTLVAHEGILRGADPDSGVWDDPRLEWLPPSMAVTWRELLPVDQIVAVVAGGEPGRELLRLVGSGVRCGARAGWDAAHMMPAHQSRRPLAELSWTTSTDQTGARRPR